MHQASRRPRRCCVPYAQPTTPGHAFQYRLMCTIYEVFASLRFICCCCCCFGCRCGCRAMHPCASCEGRRHFWTQSKITLQEHSGSRGFRCVHVRFVTMHAENARKHSLSLSLSRCACRGFLCFTPCIVYSICVQKSAYATWPMLLYTYF